MELFRRFFCVLAVCFWMAGSAFAQNFNYGTLCGFRYGPNLSWTFSGNTPFVWGQWLPQAYGSLHYTWLEPLDRLTYGDKLGRTPSYWRMDAAVEVTPFYGGYLAGIGIRPFQFNPQLELNVTYESYLYFKSNLEMVTADVKGGGRIAETWNADYITNNVFNDEAEFDYAQLVDMSAVLTYAFPRGSILGVSMHYILSDVSTDYNGKSYDYKRNIPVFSRDFLIEFENFGRIPLNENFALLYETTYYRTGYLRSEHTVQKEALSYGKMLLGGHFSWNDGFQNISLEVGAWKRFKERFYDGKLSQRFLVQLTYEGYFSFPFHRNAE
ncbi:MAG: hypothetical protein MJY87_05005 [Fibrobacter sp.]|nr:hypothetical protein [Fibrobacter sp.]